MTDRTPVPFGAWSSPITADLIATGSIRLSEVSLRGEDLCWLESRPTEGGRYVVVRRDSRGDCEDINPPDTNARTRVHEYGGASYMVAEDVAFFSNYADQRLYRRDRGDDPIAITPAPEIPAGLRYADMQLTPDGRTIVCVRERHATEGEAVNEIVTLPANGTTEPVVIGSGRDFYAFPRVSPDGAKVSWVEWDHPNMPWDGTELVVADLAADGTASNARRMAGGPAESIYQPEWSPEGVLYLVSDRTGWWNLYQLDGTDLIPLTPMDAEFGGPAWSLDAGQYAFLSGGRIVCVYGQDGIHHLGVIEPGKPGVRDVATPFTAFASIDTDGGERVAVVAGGPVIPGSVALIDMASGATEVVKRSNAAEIDPGYLSPAQPIEFPTTGGKTAHALYYAPRNRDAAAPEGELPPLLVFSHGGPTGQTTGALNLSIQYWTSRGLAVVDVNYGGSTGYGREYRERLKDNWGIVDVDDCANAARYLAGQGLVDGARMAIRGGSAGGYTTLAALTFTDVFAAGASHFGISDLETMTTDTHKFESRYLDGLVGPYPEARDIYLARSPAYHTELLSAPMIIFQGLEDKVVPPSQAEAMVAALDRKGLPYAYLAFEGEQHGFRRAENISRTLEAELYFYGKVFGFQPSDEIEPVMIVNEG